MEEIRGVEEKSAEIGKNLLPGLFSHLYRRAKRWRNATNDGAAQKKGEGETHKRKERNRLCTKK